MSKNSKSASRKYVLWSVLLVLLTLPQTSFEFEFKFTDDDDDGNSGPVAKRRITERKFKFRKIERISIEDDDNDDISDNNDDVDSDGDDDDDRSESMKRRIKQDDDDEDDEEEKRESRYERASAASSRTNEDEEFQFERVHQAQKDKHNPNVHGKAAGKTPSGGRSSSSRKASKARAEPEEAESPFFGSYFSGWFGSSKKDNDNAKKKRAAKPVKDDDDDDDGGDGDSSQTNGIIDWLKWLGEKTGRIKPAPPPEPKSTEGWLSYFNRWPFNSLFPIGRPQKPIRVPRRAAAARRSRGGGGGDDDDDDSDDDDASAEAPMSEEHFQSLLHTLPGFVVNASHVGDIECRQQMQIFHRQLRGNKLWTLQMLDASGKISSGLLRGNINQFGDFDLCTQIKTVVKVTPDKPFRVRGKYCLAHIETQTAVPELKVPVHLAHGRGLWNSHLVNPGHFVPRYAIANWGVCIPHLCSGDVVQEMIETNLRPYNTTGVEFHVEVSDQDCYVRQSRRLGRLLKKDAKFGITVFYLGSLGVLMLAALLAEYWKVLRPFLRSKLETNGAETTESESVENDEKAKETVAKEKEAKATQEEKTADEEATAGEEPTGGEDEAAAEVTEPFSIKHLLREIFFSFSPRRTLSELLSLERPDTQFPIFHVLKLGATLMLYVCLKYLMIGHLPLTNRDRLVRTVDHPLSVAFRSPMIYSDVLLLISGFLSAYQLVEEMEQRSHIQLLKRLAAKVLRYLPTVYVVLFFQTWILPHLGSGPLWSSLVGQQANLCEQQMWRNVFSVQNAIDFEETCSPMTIQLALELQLYLLGPLLVWLYYTDSDAGFFIYGAIHAMSVAARFSRTNREHLSMTLFHGMNVSKFYRTANILFSSPISRATPYLLGIGAGLLHRSEGGSLDILPEFVPVGWLLCIAGIAWCFWSPASGMRSDYIYSSSEAAAYASWSPLVLGLALVWLIFMFPRRNGDEEEEESAFHRLASARPLLFLSRISFPMQVASYVVVLSSTASTKEASRFHLTDLVSLGEIATIVVCATALAFLIDVPAQNIRRLLVNRLFIERSHQDQEPEEQDEAVSSGGENSDAEVSDHVTLETPEPAETVWSSDPEEEEHKFLTRRRSSALAQGEATTTGKEKIEEDEEEEEVEEVEEEVENDIPEAAEVKRRPASPTPPVKEEKEEPKPTARRRRTTADD